MKNQTVKTFTNGKRQAIFTPQQIAYMTKGADGRFDGQWVEVVNEVPKEVGEHMKRLQDYGTGKDEKNAAVKPANENQPKKPQSTGRGRRKHK